MRCCPTKSSPCQSTWLVSPSLAMGWPVAIGLGLIMTTASPVLAQAAQPESFSASATASAPAPADAQEPDATQESARAETAGAAEDADATETAQDAAEDADATEAAQDAAKADAAPPGEGPTAEGSAESPSAEDVRSRLRTVPARLVAKPDVSFHLARITPEAGAAGHDTELEDFVHVCMGACETELPYGEYRVALSKGAGAPVVTHQRLAIAEGPERQQPIVIDGMYSSRAKSRAMGKAMFGMFAYPAALATLPSIFLIARDASAAPGWALLAGSAASVLIGALIDGFFYEEDSARVALRPLPDDLP